MPKRTSLSDVACSSRSILDFGWRLISFNGRACRGFRSAKWPGPTQSIPGRPGPAQSGPHAPGAPPSPFPARRGGPLLPFPAAARQRPPLPFPRGGPAPARCLAPGAASPAPGVASPAPARRTRPQRGVPVPRRGPLPPARPPRPPARSPAPGAAPAPARSPLRAASAPCAWPSALARGVLAPARLVWPRLPP
jgi:hypothetical protein